MGDHAQTRGRRLQSALRKQFARARDLLEILISEAASLLADLRTAAGTNDVKTARERAHALRGIAANTGALRLETVARGIDDVVRSEPLLELEDRFAATDAALEELKHLCAALAPERPARDYG